MIESLNLFTDSLAEIEYNIKLLQNPSPLVNFHAILKQYRLLYVSQMARLGLLVQAKTQPTP